MAETPSNSQVGRLTFDPDKGAARSKWIAGLFTLALVGWMGSGYLETADPEASKTTAVDDRAKPVTVAVMASQADNVQLVLRAEGQSEPDRSAAVRAEVGGQITSVSVARGELVEAGQEIGRVDATTIVAQQTQAETQLDQATRDFENALELQDRGIATEDRVTAARAAVAAAEASLTSTQEQLAKAIIRAPFAGRVNDLTLDVGEFVDGGDVVAEVLDNDPLMVVIQVPQQALGGLEVGQIAQVDFITGETRPAEISFIGGNADQQTRTFQVELTVDNPGSVMPAGLSARVTIPTGTDRGHFVSPAILSLATDGTLGVKTVDLDSKVVFSPVSIVRAQTDGIWITGLSETVQIITVGQGFVSAGDVVDPRPVSSQPAAEVTQ